MTSDYNAILTQYGTRHSRALAGGGHFRKVRESKGLTQQELTDRIDVEVMQISRVERGTVNTSICMIKEVADNLNIQLSELFSSFEKN
ncbi:hypothetical protein GCM10022291_34990 [Postechiella marina]|uniref:HTH cro/C1-type domain-containing protein n=1 Tax=Postechiella marina TaxID=943941 RepID=A0ABP8CI98_9FLAO